MKRTLRLLKKIEESRNYETIKRYFTNIEIEDVQIIPAHCIQQEYDTLEDLYLDHAHFAKRVSKVGELVSADIVVLTLVNDDIKLYKAGDIEKELGKDAHPLVKRPFLDCLQLDRVVTETIDPKAWYE